MKKPQLRSDLIVSQQVQRGIVVFVVKDPLDGQYFKFGETEYQVLRQMDGTRSMREVLDAANRALPDMDLGEEDIKDFVASVNKMNLLEKSLEEKNAMLVSRLREDRKNQLLSKKGSALYKRFPLFDPDRLFDKMHPYISFLWKKPVVILLICFMLSAGCIIMYHWREVLEGIKAIYSLHGKSAHGVFMLWATVLTVIALHEFAHGLTCKNFGGHVHEIGFLLLFFQPCMYCNVNDAYAFTNKRHKLYTVFAGGFFEFLLGSCFAYIWVLTNPDTTLNAVAYQVMTVCGFSSVLFNFNPLMKFDGYYALTDYVEIPNLKQEAFGFLKYVSRTYLFRLGDSHEYDHYDFRTKRILFAYGVCSFIYMSGILIGILFIVKMFVLDSLKEIGLLIIMLVAVKTFGPHAKKSTGFMKEFMMLKNITLLSGKGIVILVVAIAVIGALLFAVPFPATLTTTCSLVAMNKIPLRTAVAGQLKQVNFHHCDRVKTGDVLVELVNSEKELALRQKEMELESQEYQFKLAASSGDAYQKEKFSLQIATLRKEIIKIQNELANLKIVVPEDAIVLTEDLDFEIGRQYGPGEIIAELFPTSTINAEITIIEEDISYLKQETPIKLKLHAFPRVTYDGMILKLLPNETEKGQQKEFTALAEFSTTSSQQIIYPGMTGMIKVKLDKTTGFGLISSWLIRTFRFDMMFF